MGDPGDVPWNDKASEEGLTAVVEAMVTVPGLLVLVSPGGNSQALAGGGEAALPV